VCGVLSTDENSNKDRMIRLLESEVEQLKKRTQIEPDKDKALRLAQIGLLGMFSAIARGQGSGINNQEKEVSMGQGLGVSEG
jgi:hypothetical protein